MQVDKTVNDFCVDSEAKQHPRNRFQYFYSASVYANPLKSLTFAKGNLIYGKGKK